MAFGLDELINKVEKFQKELPKKAAPKLKPLFKETVKNATDDFYDDYKPKKYKRTFNFGENAFSDSDWKVTSKGIEISMYGSEMRDYIDLETGGAFDARLVFGFAYMEGKHGYGDYLGATSTPPHLTVAEKVNNGFDGQADKILVQCADEYFSNNL